MIRHSVNIRLVLAGDELYGGSRQRIGRQALHCARMEFTEPGTQKTVVVESPLPPDMQSLME